MQAWQQFLHRCTKIKIYKKYTSLVDSEFVDVPVIILISEIAAENMESQESWKKGLAAHHIETEEIGYLQQDAILK